MATSVAEYGTFTIPSGSASVLMERDADATVKVRFAVAVCTGGPESVTLKLNGVAFAGAVGIPLITPVDVFSVNPAGNLPEVNCQVVEPVAPIAVRVWEYAVPNRPFGSEDVAIVSVGGAIVRPRLAVAV